MNVHAVYSYTALGDGEGEGLHARAWAADWHAWQIARRNLNEPFRWLPDPTWGPAGWTDRDTGTEADVWVVPLAVTVP
ncbi:hypothetical protein [Streptomyces sp. NPDC015131]|uniref:hypothetical protein n=1 Tax=Streptomyces sp. NPDC015131 TaxID=3364941 RepID=UPI00370109A2